MRKYEKRKGISYHKKDMVLVIGVLLGALILSIIFWRKHTGSGDYIEITVDGELYGRYPLEQPREIAVKSAYGSNTVVIENGEAIVRQADCPDKICVGMRPVSGNGEIICCLPHRMFVRARSEEEAPYDAVTY